MPAQPRWKRFGFRAAAIALGLLPLVAIELCFRAASLGTASETSTPAIGFEALHPLFELNPDGSRYETARSRRSYFYPDSFAARKDPREFRIFCLGGSTVQGRPYSIETSFATWLELSLNAADSSRVWEVVNCGGVSYASYRLVPIVEEVLRYEPDLLIIYSGHNEFLEARTYDYQEQPWFLRRIRACMSRVHVYNWLRTKVVTDQPARAAPPVVLKQEVDALLDYRGGLADYHRNDAWQEAIVEDYANNLRRMIHLANEAAVPIILMHPVSNLRDCPPFKVEADAALDERQQIAFEEAWDAARQTKNPDERIALLEAAVAIDGRRADALFLLAHACLARNEEQPARRYFLQAKDEDVCPLRMIEPLHARLQAVADETQTPLLDSRPWFQERSRSGIPGDELLVDHIHPSITGHQMIADQITRYLIDRGIVQPQATWESLREESFRSHLDTLDAVYYAKGKQRLEGLLRWTQGRANKLRDGTPLPPGLDEPPAEP